MSKFIKGQSGNPRGRPPKSRTLSAILANKAEELTFIEGNQVKRNQEIIAHHLWQFATTGEVRLSSGTLQAKDVSDWFNAVRWIYTHIDGPATNRFDADELTITIQRTPSQLTDE
ncbi:MAG: DUF5681 domain-containing protein [Chloroflexota bacterium]